MKCDELTSNALNSTSTSNEREDATQSRARSYSPVRSMTSRESRASTMVYWKRKKTGELGELMRRERRKRTNPDASEFRNVVSSTRDGMVVVVSESIAFVCVPGVLRKD